MLDKSLAEVEASRIAIKALTGEAAAWKRSAESEEAARKATERVNELLHVENARLRAVKCNETKWLWGVRKTKTCF